MACGWNQHQRTARRAIVHWHNSTAALCLAIALVVTTCAQALAAEEPNSPQWFLDVDYEWRRHQDFGWQGFGGMFRVPWDHFFGHEGDPRQGQWRLYKSGLSARYERGYGMSPNAERVMAGAVFSLGVEESWRFADMDPKSDLAHLGFPFLRSRVAGFGAITTLGWAHSRGTLEADGASRIETQDALRLENTVFFSVHVVGVRGLAAVNWNLREGPALEWEYGIWLTLGADFLPVGFAVGYHYIGTERAGGGALSLRLMVQL